MQHAKNNFTDMTIDVSVLCFLLHFDEYQIQLKVKLDSLKKLWEDQIAVF